MKRAKPRALASGSTSRMVSLPEALRRGAGFGAAGVAWARRESGCLAATLLETSLGREAEASGLAGVKLRAAAGRGSRAGMPEGATAGVGFFGSRITTGSAGLCAGTLGCWVGSGAVRSIGCGVVRGGSVTRVSVMGSLAGSVLGAALAASIVLSGVEDSTVGGSLTDR